MLATGSWEEIRKLRKGFTPKQGRLKNYSGEVVSSELRAETFAEYLERDQWAERPCRSPAEPPPSPCQLLVFLGDISEDEVLKAAKHLRRNRACGVDGIPAEFWKAIALKNTTAMASLLSFCQECWRQKAVPLVWHDALVVELF